jgi:hypothetical protein
MLVQSHELWCAVAAIKRIHTRVGIRYHFLDLNFSNAFKLLGESANLLDASFVR